MAFQLVRPGGCVPWNDPNTTKCALTKKECSANESFVSADKTTACPLAAADMQIGRCDGQCATGPDSCRTGSGFEPGRGCSVSNSNNNSSAPTFYTSCRRDGLCVWDALECRSVLAYHDEQCDCSRVHIGACFLKGRQEASFYCAVSKDACGDDALYVSAHALLERRQENISPWIECRLCDEDKRHMSGRVVGLIICCLVGMFIAIRIYTKIERSLTWKDAAPPVWETEKARKK